MVAQAALDIIPKPPGHPIIGNLLDLQGDTPLLNLVEVMVISGIVLFGFGLMGELIAGMQEELREVARDLARLDKPDMRD